MSKTKEEKADQYIAYLKKESLKPMKPSIEKMLRAVFNNGWELCEVETATELAELKEQLREVVQSALSYQRKYNSLIKNLSPTPEGYERWKDFDIAEYLKECNSNINIRMVQKDDEAISKARRSWLPIPRKEEE